MGSGHPRSSSAIFQQEYFWPPMHRKSILDIRKGQNQVKVTKFINCKFTKSVFLTSHAQKKHFTHQERSRSSKVIKYNFSQSVFLTSHAHHFRHQERSKSGQGHQRSSSAILQKVYFWLPTHRKSILHIRKGQNEVKVIHGHQAHFFKMCIFDLPCTEKAF